MACKLVTARSTEGAVLEIFMSIRQSIRFALLGLGLTLNSGAGLSQEALYKDYNAMLMTHVDEAGQVNYAALKADRGRWTVLYANSTP